MLQAPLGVREGCWEERGAWFGMGFVGAKAYGLPKIPPMWLPSAQQSLFPPTAHKTNSVLSHLGDKECWTATGVQQLPLSSSSAAPCYLLCSTTLCVAG